LGFAGLNQELGIGAIGQVSGFGTITEEDWMQECMEQGSLQWECSLAWDVPLVMAQILGGPGYDGFGSYIISEPSSGDFCNDEGCTTTQPADNGHDFETSNVVCRDASLVSLEDQQNTVAWFTVPRHFGYIVDVRIGTAGETRYFVTHPDTGAPGGWVTSELLPDGLSGINTTVPRRHFFQGTVERELVNVNGQLVFITHGIGTSDVELMDFLNQAFGPGVFDALDRHAADRLSRSFPGC